MSNIWSRLINLAGNVTGTLGATHGGTGQSAYTTGDVLYSSATNVLSKLATGTIGQVFRQAASSLPTWGWADVITSTSASYPAASFTSDGTTVLLVTTAGNTITVTLPTAASPNVGRQITVKKVDAGAGKITFATTSSQTVDGWTTTDFASGAATRYAYITMVSDGTAWNVTATGGDFVTASATGTSIPTTDTAVDVISGGTSIPAGFWSVWVFAEISGMTSARSATLLGTQTIISLSTTTATLSGSKGFSNTMTLDSTSHVAWFTDNQVQTSPQDIRLTAATSYFTVARARFGGGTVTADGAIFATRIG